MRINFTLEKETKGAIRYQEDQATQLSEPVIGTLYIRKSGLAKLGYTQAPTQFHIDVPEATK